MYPSYASSEAFKVSKGDFEWVRRRIKESAGIDLGEEKIELVTGRIARRVRSLQLDSVRSYRELLESELNGPEWVEFVNALTTNVTSFFREAYHFEALRGFVQSRPSTRLRVWSAGCSSGEEPYSVAITLFEVLGDRMDHFDIKILATDIDTAVLERARTATYPIERLEGLSNENLRLGFLKGKGPQAGSVRIKPKLAQRVRFKRLNLIEPWPMQQPFDHIFCRNVMIYFDKDTRNDLLRRFANQLSPGGYLYIGHSETIEAEHALLEPMGRTIYRRKERS